MRTHLLQAAALALALAPAAVFAQSTTAPADSANPPGTAASRTLDRAAGTNTSGAYPSQSDGTAENPRGTAASRATDNAVGAPKDAQNLKNNSATRTLDRAAGTDNSGAYPTQADGMPGNPKGTAVSRALGTTDKK